MAIRGLSHVTAVLINLVGTLVQGANNKAAVQYHRHPPQEGGFKQKQQRL